jgi:HEAT repeat protein
VGGLVPAGLAQDFRRLIGNLKDANPDVRIVAAGTLEDTKDPRAVKPLIATLTDLPPHSGRYFPHQVTDSKLLDDSNGADFA